MTRRGDRLLERRRKQAQFRDPQVTLDGKRKEHMELLATVPLPLLIIDDLGMR
jgi:hypothetical protein